MKYFDLQLKYFLKMQVVLEISQIATIFLRRRSQKEATTYERYAIYNNNQIQADAAQAVIES